MFDIEDDLFGGPLFGEGSERDRKRDRIRRNRRQGRAAEEQVAMELTMEGYEVERTHVGADFIARRRDLLSRNVIEERNVEVKSGNASLSDRQKQEQRRSDNFEVRRRNPFFFDF